MILRTCGYCRQRVEVDGGTPHVHDPKICADCKRELPASTFPEWPSSADGRRHSCQACSAGRRREASVRQTAGRIRQREQDNESLRQHGYRWERRWRDGQTQWRLLDGSGRVVRKENALEELHRAVYEGSEEEFW